MLGGARVRGVNDEVGDWFVSGKGGVLFVDSRLSRLSF